MSGRIYRRLTDLSWWLEYENAEGQLVQADTRTSNIRVAERLLGDVMAQVARQRAQAEGAPGAA